MKKKVIYFMIKKKKTAVFPQHEMITLPSLWLYATLIPHEWKAFLD